ncbi:MAG: hypothetical protein ACNYNX_03295 [Leucobacter sp.]
MIDALIVGRSLPALQTALDLAEVGLGVMIAGPAETERSAETPERDPDGTILTLIARAAEPLPSGESHEHPEIEPQRSLPPLPLLRDRAGARHRQPEPNVWGIPAVPLAADTIALLGVGGALRAYRDRLAPLLTVGKTRSLGELARRRLGRAAHELLVEPQLRERYGVPAEEVEVAIAAPGLNEALTRTGSLSAAALAYSDRHAQRETGVLPTAGWIRLREVLSDRLGLYGVGSIEARVSSVQLRDDGSWRVELEDGTGIEARALAVEGTLPWESRPAEALLDEVRPAAVRVHAEIGIEAPEGEPETEATEIVELRSVGEWSLRSAGAGRAELRGPRCSADAVADPVPELDRVLQEAGIRPNPDAEWSWELRAAPYASVDQRKKAGAALAGLAQRQPTLLPLGRALYGDDLSAALGAAHSGAVMLRRRLLGLSD